MVRNHRLWEEYLMTYADISPSHVDYSADLVEHTLSPEIVRALESALSVKERFSDSAAPPKSVHTLKGEKDG